MPKYTWIILAALSAGMLAGCASDDLDDSGATRQEGDIHTSDEGINQRARSPLLGDTTGGGQPRDLRTGGGTTGSDVPAGERLDEARRIREADPSANKGPIPVDPGPIRDNVNEAD